MARLQLTRESLLDGLLHASVRAVLGPEVRFMSDSERAAQVQAILARAPLPGRVWVFAFGSLMWNPTFHFVERAPRASTAFTASFACGRARGAAVPAGPA